MGREFIAEKTTDRASTIAEHSPTQKTGGESLQTTTRPRRGGAKSYSPPVAGARVTPTYIERTPAMWAVGEVDIRAISDDSLVANFAFAFASFLLGFALNILVTYGGMEKLTETGALMLHKGTAVLIILAGFFYVVGIVMTYRKNAIWEQIKKESKQIQ